MDHNCWDGVSPLPMEDYCFAGAMSWWCVTVLMTDLFDPFKISVLKYQSVQKKFACPHPASPLLSCEIKINVGPELLPASRWEDGAFISRSLHAKKDRSPLLQLQSTTVDAFQLVTHNQQCLLISTVNTEACIESRRVSVGSRCKALRAPLPLVSGTPWICFCAAPLYPQIMINLNLFLSLLRLDRATAFLSHWFFCPCGFRARVESS